MKKLAIIGGILAMLVLLASLLLPSLAWSGGASPEFRFHIFDSHSNSPITNAFIRVIQERQLEYLSDTNQAGMFSITTTDITGAATVFVSCGAGGQR